MLHFKWERSDFACCDTDEISPQVDNNWIGVEQQNVAVRIARTVPGRASKRLDDGIVQWGRISGGPAPFAAVEAEKGPKRRHLQARDEVEQLLSLCFGHGAPI